MTLETKYELDEDELKRSRGGTEGSKEKEKDSREYSNNI